MYFQFVSQYPRATEEVLPVMLGAQATVLLAIEYGKIEKIYIGVYVESEARLLEQVLLDTELQSICRNGPVDRDVALTYAKLKAVRLARLFFRA